MKILITGCRGQLGTELQRQLSAEGCVLGPLPERLCKATVIPVDIDDLDITDREATVAYILSLIHISWAALALSAAAWACSRAFSSSAASVSSLSLIHI